MTYKKFLVLLLILSQGHTCNSTIQKNTSEISLNQKVDTLEEVKIGGVRQWILSRGDDIHKPILLILHGGPGAASIGFAREFYKDLEKHFIVVNWDQRGSGKSFSFFMDDVSPDTYVSDTSEVIDYLRSKFNKNKVYLMGHSWGGYISAMVAHQHADKISSLILIGPVIRARSSLEISYQYIKTNKYDNLEIQKKANDLSFDDYFSNRRYWLNANCVGLFRGKHCHDESAYLRGIMLESPDYNIFNVLSYLPGIWKSSSRIKPYFLEMNLFQNYTEFNLPVHLIIGKFDYYNPLPVAEEYLNALKAPKKTLTVLEGLAHAPHFEEPKLFTENLLKLVGE